jgi:hypothetical protein
MLADINRGDPPLGDHRREPSAGTLPLLGGLDDEGDEHVPTVVTPVALEDVALEVVQSGPDILFGVPGRRDLDVDVKGHQFQV